MCVLDTDSSLGQRSKGLPCFSAHSKYTLIKREKGLRHRAFTPNVSHTHARTSTSIHDNTCTKLHTPSHSCLEWLLLPLRPVSKITKDLCSTSFLKHYLAYLSSHLPPLFAVYNPPDANQQTCPPPFSPSLFRLSSFAVEGMNVIRAPRHYRVRPAGPISITKARRSQTSCKRTPRRTHTFTHTRTHVPP